jgi:KDO2-lipid IV(A) lauroyltransferase
VSRGRGERTGYGLYLALSALLSLLPRPAVLTLGYGLGILAFRLDRRHREIALGNLEIAFGPKKTAREKMAVARESFGQIGRVTLEVVKFTRYSRNRVLRLVRVEGGEHLAAARAGGRGVLAFTAHYGNWEASTAPISEFGPYRVVARVLDNRLIDRHLGRLRERLGARIIDKIGAGKPVLRALAAGETVGIVIDQNVLRSQAVFVDFFGKPAATTPSLAAFHLKTGAPLVPFFCVPRGRALHLKILPPVEIPALGRGREEVLKITGICTKIIEDEIRRAPEPWLWVHKRWNTRPADESRTP